MASEIIKPHKFEIAKNNIHSLAQTVPNVSLQRFPTEGSIFSCNEHNITGNEANLLLVSPLQSTLIAQNSTIRSLFNIADEVYNALESLDKEYIQGIIVAVKSAEIASDQAKTASNKANTASSQALEASRKALDASTKATTAQADIKRTIEALQATVRVLKEFKEKVTKDLSSIASLNTRITSVNNKVQIVENKISNIAVSHKTDLAIIHQQVDTFVEKVNQATSRIDDDIEALKKYHNLLESYQHLSDVDVIWNNVEDHKTNLSGLHEKLDVFIKETSSRQERLEKIIQRMEADHNLVLLQYNKKIKIAYWVGGSAVGLTVINYILQITGIL